MSLERWREVDRIFAEALELPDSEREAYLDEACAGDVELRASIEQLLAEDGALDSFLEEPLAAGALEELTREERQVGPYRLLGRLGTGGMGAVYLAEQSEPVERKVALKLIKPGLDSAQVLARFAAERQALALMDHANVATVYEAGCTDSGRSYFAMEYVPGHEITEHCDRAELGIRERVRLFLQVCEGVQHAHQKGLIHRDLKPSNILVRSSMGEKAAVKIIDFGVAKSLQRKLTAKAAYTQLGTFVGTPVYSSPEQIMGRFTETDTRSDIYSLGVVLYELLVGAAPHELEDFEGKTQEEIARMLSEEPPPAPLERFSTAIENAAAVARRRSLTVEELQRRLGGDVSWILLKCLERRPEDRYPSVSDLRQDLERWLDGRPLEARPTTGLYRLQKLVRRHRKAVATAAVVTVALLVTTAAAVIGFVRAERAAEQARESAEEARLAANFQVEQLQEIDPAAMGVGLRSELLESVRGGLVGAGSKPEAVEAEVDGLDGLLRHANFTDLSLSLLDRHLFERADTAIGERYADSPRLQARLWQSLAATRMRLGQYDDATTPQERALEIRRDALGAEHPETVESLRSRGRMRLKQGKLDEAQADLEEALALHRRALGEEHPETLRSLSAVVELLQAKGQLEEAEEHSRQVLEARRRLLGAEDRETLSTLGRVGLVLEARGQFAEAERFHRQALEGRRRTLGDRHPSTLDAIGNLGLLLHRQGKLDEAEAYYREALEGQRAVLGEMHPSTLSSLGNLGSLLSARDQLDEAEPYYRQALDGAPRARQRASEHAHLGGQLGFPARSAGQAGRGEDLLPRSARDSPPGAR